MPDSQRPDPDALLASLKRDETRARRGRLKVFFGMCPGVGKTYAMLRAAQQELRDGTDLVVGVVETHKRVETESLLAGLPVIPRKEIAYRDIQLTEMDLEAILARKPRLVLVDEFAHTNAPGSRHPKRYQDVVELLDAGIDVFTTLNVQHIESRADAVRQITGATVHETVPDSVFELADQIELVDLTPEALRERLQEGKVYLGDRATAAAEGFFKDTHLTALRELALRFVAERVDKRLRELRGASPIKTIWRSGERLLVAVGPSPSSTQLVRWTRKMAAAQGASWIAVSVESSTALEGDARRRLEQNLALARELGAEVVVTHDEDVADALVRVALQNNATQIVVIRDQSSTSSLRAQEMARSPYFLQIHSDDRGNDHQHHQKQGAGGWDGQPLTDAVRDGRLTRSAEARAVARPCREREKQHRQGQSNPTWNQKSCDDLLLAGPRVTRPEPCHADEPTDAH